MSNVISIITRQPITQANDRITSASLEINRIMHLRAHGWQVIKYEQQYICRKVDDNVWWPLDDAWKIQKLSEQARRYGI